MKKLIQKTFLAFLLTLTFQASHTQAATMDVTMGALPTHHIRTSYDGRSTLIEPTCLLVNTQKPTHEQQAFQNKITQLGKNKVHINQEFYQSIVQIILHAFLRALNEPGYYGDHYKKAAQYIHELLGRNENETTWGINNGESPKDYEQRITQLAKQAMASFFPSTDYGEFIVFNELVRSITDQFRPFYIQGEEPWFIPSQEGRNTINLFYFVMQASGHVHGFLNKRNDISHDKPLQINFRLFEGVTDVWSS